MKNKIKRCLNLVKEWFDDTKNLIISVLLLVCILSLITNISYEKDIDNQVEVINQLQSEVSSLKNDLSLAKKELEEKDNELNLAEEENDQLAVKLNKRDWPEYWTSQLLVEMVNNNHQAYFVRNEILYYNQEMSVEEASYQALWIYTRAKENDVHPYLMTAIFIQESRLRHINSNGNLTQSGAGARGIGQLMPVIERIYSVDSTIFEENIKGATMFISDLQNMYEDLDGVLGHYNGGSRPYHAIENYEETRNFVAKVTHMYESMLEKYN